MFQNELSQEQSRLENVTEDDTQGIELLPLTADNVKTVAPESWTSPSKRKHSDSSSVATLGSTNSRGMDMTPGSTGPFVNNDNPPPSAWHEEFASPTPRPNKISGLVEDLEKCRTFEQPESPVIGRRDLPDREPQVMGLNTTKSPEMQERAGRPPPFMTNRPVNQASQVASDADSLMDMDMNIDTEHIEG